jgi:hypothetical protein
MCELDIDIGDFGSMSSWPGQIGIPASAHKLNSQLCGRNAPEARETPHCGPRNLVQDNIRHLVLALDRYLRRCYEIVEFCESDDCILRIARQRAEEDVVLPGDIRVCRGDWVIGLHFWNEHLADLLHSRCSLGWKRELGRRVEKSLELLADYVDSNRDPAIRALHGRGVFVAGDWLNRLAAMARYYGFTITSPKVSLTERVHDLGEDMLVHALIWAFHFGQIHEHERNLQRMHFWISREELLRRYGFYKGRSRSREVGEEAQLSLWLSDSPHLRIRRERGDERLRADRYTSSAKMDLAVPD